MARLALIPNITRSTLKVWRRNWDVCFLVEMVIRRVHIGPDRSRHTVRRQVALFIILS